jgi:hypothetical protein
MSAYLDALSGAGYDGSDSGGIGDVGLMASDVADYQQMQPYAGGGNQQAPWWQSVIQYGMTRAIDNRYGPTSVTGNVQSGTFAGANGQTYYQAPNGQRIAVAPASQQTAGISMNTMMLLGLAGLAFFALKG